MPRKSLLATSIAAALAAAAPAAHAGIPVIDVTMVANAMQQIAHWQSQLAAMTQQYNQLRAQTSALTGGRGMETLLPVPTSQRTYLPTNPADLWAIVNGGGGGGYSGLATQAQAILRANSVLTSAQMGALSPEMRAAVEAGRAAASIFQASTQTAYQQTSQRYGALQQLVTAVGTTPDAKASADLQARIAAEQAMLANEQNKLTMLYQMAQADRWAQEQRNKEAAVAGFGSWANQVRVTY